MSHPPIVFRRAIPLALAAVLLALPASAAADAFSRVDSAYKKTGTINPCRFSTATLSAALRQESTYDAQYFQDFSTAVQAALAARAGGHCQAGPAGTAISLPRAGATPPGGSAPRSITAATDAGVPAPILLLGLFAALLAAGGALWAFARSRAWDPLWAADWRHACAEAGYRLRAVGADLSDRLGAGRHGRVRTPGGRD